MLQCAVERVDSTLLCPTPGKRSDKEVAESLTSKFQNLLKALKRYHRMRVMYIRRIQADVVVHESTAVSMTSELKLLRDTYDLEGDMNHHAKRGLTDDYTVHKADNKCCPEKNANKGEGKEDVQDSRGIKEKDCKEHRAVEGKVKEEKGINGQKHGDALGRLLQFFPILEKIHDTFLEDLVELKRLDVRLHDNIHKMCSIQDKISFAIQNLSKEEYDLKDISWALCNILTVVFNVDHMGDVCLDEVCRNIYAISDELSPSSMLCTKFESDTDSNSDCDHDSNPDPDICDFCSVFSTNLKFTSSNNLKVFGKFSFMPVEILRKRLFSYVELYEEIIQALDISLIFDIRKAQPRLQEFFVPV